MNWINKKKRKVPGSTSTVNRHTPAEHKKTGIRMKIGEEEVAYFKRYISHGSGADEHRSPISILDASLCQDDLPPMRISSYASEDIEIQESVNWCNADSAHDAPSAKISSGFNQKKLENIEGLVQKLSQLSSSDSEAPAAAPIAFLCDDQGADHRYVPEISLASGLRMLDVSSRPMSTQLQLHPSGHPINPDMFLVLEQTHSARLTKPDSAEEDSNRLKLMRERLHRKLVFDVVNELLIQKLKLASPGHLPDIPLQVRKAGFFSGRQVLKELCSEIDHLKAESFPAENCYGNNSLISCDRMLQHSEYWINPSTELQMIALEMERSIFRDLIDESVVPFISSNVSASIRNRELSLITHCSPTFPLKEISLKQSYGLFRLGSTWTN